MDTITIASDNYAIVAAPEVTVTVVDVGGVVAVPQPETVVVSVGEVGPPGDTSAFGTMAVQDADDVAITGGSISVPIVTATTEFRGTVLTSNAASAVDFYTSGGKQFVIGHVANAVNQLVAFGGTAGNAAQLNAIGSDTNVGMSFFGKNSGYFNFDPGGGVGFRVGYIASATNWAQANGGAAGAPAIFSAGADTDVSFSLASKGTGSLAFYTNNFAQQQFRINHTASAVNYLSATGAVTGSSPGIYPAGSDTDIGMLLSSKGTGTHNFYSNSFASQQFRIGNTASAVNFVEALGGSTGNAVTLKAAGTDTNISYIVSSKGTGSIAFYTNNFAATQLQISHIANAVNYPQLGGGAAGSSGFFAVQGADTDVGITFSTKGAGGFGVYSHAGAALQAWFPGTASAVNYARITGGTTGNPPSITGTGSDTNVDLSLPTKGTGVLRFGTHSALAAEALSGYITIKDSGGTTRKLAVIS